MECTRHPNQAVEDAVSSPSHPKAFSGWDTLAYRDMYRIRFCGEIKDRLLQFLPSPALQRVAVKKQDASPATLRVGDAVHNTKPFCSVLEPTLSYGASSKWCEGTTDNERLSAILGFEDRAVAYITDSHSLQKVLFLLDVLVTGYEALRVDPYGEELLVHITLMHTPPQAETRFTEQGEPTEALQQRSKAHTLSNVSNIRLPIPPRGLVKTTMPLNEAPSVPFVFSESMATVGPPFFFFPGDATVEQNTPPSHATHCNTERAKGNDTATSASTVDKPKLQDALEETERPLADLDPTFIELSRPSTWIQCQYMILYCSLLCQFDCVTLCYEWVKRFICLLTSMIQETHSKETAAFRFYACDCLTELEVRYPGILSPLLSTEWMLEEKFVSMYRIADESITLRPPLEAIVMERYDVSREPYFALFATILQHTTEALVEACTLSNKHRDTNRPFLRGDAQSILFEAYSKWKDTSPSIGIHPLRLHVLPRPYIKQLNPFVAVFFEAFALFSEWTKMYISHPLRFFSVVLNLGPSVILHHLQYLLANQSLSLVHTFLTLARLHFNALDAEIIKRIFDRLVSIISTPTLLPYNRVLATRWLISLSDFPALAKYADEMPSVFLPLLNDPRAVIQEKLTALFLCFRRSNRLPTNILEALDSILKHSYTTSAADVHSITFCFLLRLLFHFGDRMHYFGVKTYFNSTLRTQPHLVAYVLSLVHHLLQQPSEKVKAIGYEILVLLGTFVSELQPASHIRYYFSVLTLMAQNPNVHPDFVVTSLSRFTASYATSAPWEVLMNVLDVCQKLMLTFPRERIYPSVSLLLYRLATKSDCLDIRDEALRTLRLFTYSGESLIRSLYHTGYPFKINYPLTSTLSQPIFLSKGYFPLLLFEKSYEERRSLGLLDGGSSIFGSALDRKERQQKDIQKANSHVLQELYALDRHRYLTNVLDRAISEDAAMEDPLLLYFRVLKEFPLSIFIPFRLTFNRADSLLIATVSTPKGNAHPMKGATLDELFFLELSFEEPPHYLPMQSVHIPFIRASLPNSDPNSTENNNDQPFPFTYKIVLKFTPIRPIPLFFGVNMAFTDALGQTYLVQLNEIGISFQDLFLPVRAPQRLWGTLYQFLWESKDTHRSVKILNNRDTEVERLVNERLAPFIVSEIIDTGSEHFDFNQDFFCESASVESVAESLKSTNSVDSDGGIDGLEANEKRMLQSAYNSEGSAEQTQEERLQYNGKEAYHPHLLDPLEPLSKKPNANKERFCEAYSEPAAALKEVLMDPFYAQYLKASIQEEETFLEPQQHQSKPMSRTPAETLSIRCLHALIGISPQYHLLMKFTISNLTTIVRIRTDHFPLLNFIDAFFSDWDNSNLRF